ncbi:disease resistance protein At4g27190-like [Eucalyptus grandis]|uniref:disease resistance protein At4g27190-like n=1 Tax=Eucalyptus grandis TaxID=71139 RepID=UPI00192E94D3|nr:disease resistance protein At4g27190-like [Eucalyptus grandis]
MSVDSVVAIAYDVFKSCVVDPVKRRFRYVISSKSFADDLREEVRNLEKEAQRVRILAEVARNNLRNFYGYFPEWQQSTDKALEEAGDLLGDMGEASKTCCHGTLPDAKCRYQFSRKAEDKIKVIKQLAQKGSGFKELNDISFTDPAPGNVTATNPARREGKDVVQSTTATASASSASTSNELSEDGVFESRTAIIRDIMGALADNSNSVVGVYGMGGVGKSTLLEHVEGEIRKEKLFDLVPKADVTENLDIKRIQEEIAHALGLSDLKNERYTSVRAELLRKRLEKEEQEKKKVLIILDNLWKGLDLKSVGIPCGHDNKVMGCKLLLTSRDRNVLQREMGCDKDFFLDRLEEKEAKILFERMVGDKVHNDEFRPMVNEALRKCAGLPLLIVTMAKHFRCGRSPEWRNALNQIVRCSNKGLSAMINMMLQLSYDHLESEEAKNLLQLCVACGASNPSVENLVRYGYGLGIFQKDSSMEDARDEVSTLIQTLQASSLLLDNGGANAFKIHDLVRDFVAQFILKDRPVLVLKDKDVLATQLQNERLKSCWRYAFPILI